MDKNLILRNLPKIDRIMDENLFSGFNRTVLKEAARDAVDRVRHAAEKGAEIPEYHAILNITAEIYKDLISGSLKKVINATGVPIHTNLGRSPLPETCFDEAREIVCGYSNLEYDLKKGRRGDRYHHASVYLRMLTGSEDAVIVNNNASAVFLVLNTLSNRKETIVSRGELVEIGGSFRVPDVMAKSGAKLREVGTTNKTRMSDYEDAVSEKTALMMKVHKSNYEIIGFSEEASLFEVAHAAKKAGVISYYDAGSGLFTKLLPDGVCNDRPVTEIIRTGVDLISFSGDKMAGACQAGIIAGRKELIAKIKKNPLMRMLRVDKMTLAVMQSILRMYITGRDGEIPVNAMLSADVYDINARAEKLAGMIKDICEARVIPIKSPIGGGSCPSAEVDSFGVEIQIRGLSAVKTEKLLLSAETPIVARIGEKVTFDVRTVRNNELHIIKEALEKTI